MKKLVIALGLAAAIFTLPSTAKADSIAFIPQILFVQTTPAPVYYHPQPRHNWQRHYRQEAKWEKHHHQRSRHVEQCRNESPRRVIWYR